MSVGVHGVYGDGGDFLKGSLRVFFMCLELMVFMVMVGILLKGSYGSVLFLFG